jgi:hypothetical protein
MKSALAVILVLLLGISPAAAQPFVIAEISGIFDREFESGATVPAGLGPGVSYTATLQYDVALAGPDIASSPTEFLSGLDPATTQFVLDASGQTWSLPSSAPPTPDLYVEHRIQANPFSGHFELSATAGPDAADFPGLFGPTNTASGRLLLLYQDPQLWNDTVGPAGDHIDNPSQIDLANAALQLFRVSASNGDSLWRVYDDDPTVTLRVEQGPVSTDEGSWSKVKALFDE